MVYNLNLQKSTILPAILLCNLTIVDSEGEEPISGLRFNCNRQRVRHKAVDSDYLFGNFLAAPCLSFKAPPAKSLAVLRRLAR